MSDSNNTTVLSLFIDVGGDRYYLGADKPIDLAYKGRVDFVNTFLKNANEDTKKNTEYLLRKYMYYNPKSSPSYKIESAEDKEKLIKILENRMASLQESQGFSSSLLKNSYFQRTYKQLQDIVEQIKQSDVNNGINAEMIQKQLNTLKAIPKDKIFALVLEMSWYLLQPEKVPKKLLRSWTDMVKKLDNDRLPDLIAKIHDIEKSKGTISLTNSYNYFKRINLGTYAKNKSALEDVVDIAATAQDDRAKEELQKRLEALVALLQLRKYLDQTETNTIGPKVNTKKLGDKLPENPLSVTASASASATQPEPSAPPMEQKGGNHSIFDKKMGVAMSPLFDFFKGMFDPVYGFVESSIHSYSATKKNTYTNTIPYLLVLLHICLHIQPSHGKEGGQPTYGVYRITNVPSELVSFIRFLINKTQEHLQDLPTDEEKNTFNEQIFQLPKIHITSLLKPLESPKAFKDPDEFPYIQIFTLGDNMELPARQTFLNSSDPKLTEQAYLSCSEFFTENNLYLVITRPSQARQNIPMNVHTIDFGQINVEENGFPIDTMPDHYFNKPKNDTPLTLEKVMKLTPYALCNDGEVALSVLIGLKERMPK